MKKLLILAFLTVAPFLAAEGAGTTVAQYVKIKDVPETTPGRDKLMLWLTGIGEGFRVSNAALVTAGGKPFYCQPPQLALNSDNYKSILDGWLERLRRQVGSKMDSYLVPEMLFFALKDAFPCPAAPPAASRA